MDQFPCLALLVAICCIGGHQSAPLLGHSSCLADDIQLKEDFDVKRFTGKWYDIGRIEATQQNSDLMSGYSQFILTDDGQLEMHYVGEIDGECQTPIVGISDIHWGPRLNFVFSPNSHDLLSLPYRVIATDYVNYAVIHNCYNQIWDDECDKDSGTVQVLGRDKMIGAAVRAWLENLVEERLCVDATKMRYVWHSADCPSRRPNSLWSILGMQNDDPDVAVHGDAKDEDGAIENQLEQEDQAEAHEDSSGQSSGEETAMDKESSGQSSGEGAEMYEDSSAEISGDAPEKYEDLSGHSSGEEAEMHEDSSAEISGEEAEIIHEDFSGENSGEMAAYDDKDSFDDSHLIELQKELLAKTELIEEEEEHIEEPEASLAELQAVLASDPQQQ